MIKVRLLFFAKARDLTGLSESTIEFAASSLNGRDLLKSIVEKFPGLDCLKNNLAVAVNEEYIDLNASVTIRENDEIALIPPISGG